jgi:hypothetical protein
MDTREVMLDRLRAIIEQARAAENEGDCLELVLELEKLEVELTDIVEVEWTNVKKCRDVHGECFLWLRTGEPAVVCGPDQVTWVDLTKKG